MAMGARPQKVMAAGHVCLDITPVFASRRAAPLGETLAPGKLVTVGEATLSTGGAVANTGLALKILGFEVKLAGKIGDDEFGGIIKKRFGAYGCAGDLLVDKKAATSYTVVLAVPGVDRMFLHNPGANDTFSAADITEEMLADVRHFHFGYPPLMRRMFLDGGAELRELLGFVKAHGVTTSLDMAAVDPASEAGSQDWPAILRNIMPTVDFFVPSIEEAAYMVDKGLHQQWRMRAGGGDLTRTLSLSDIRAVADRLMALGAKCLLLKCGAPGLYYRTADNMEEICAAMNLSVKGWAGKEGFEESYRPERVASGTGAGDTSIAAFLAGALRGKDLARCVKLAAAAGACCVATHDALGGIVPLDTLEARIDSGWEKEPGGLLRSAACTG